MRVVGKFKTRGDAMRKEIYIKKKMDHDEKEELFQNGTLLVPKIFKEIMALIKLDSWLPNGRRETD
jgi:predicted GIY-YIG superfamily endonuclease